MCCAAGPPEGPEASGCCCHHCGFSCYHCNRAKSEGAASYPWGLNSDASGSARCETRCSEASCKARCPPNSWSSNPDASGCMKPVQGVCADSTVGQHYCSRRFGRAVSRAGTTSSTSVIRRIHGGRETASAATTPSSSCSLLEGCGSTDCIMADCLRPKRLCICMVSDFFFPSLGGVEMHIYELSVRLARKGEASTRC